MTNNSSHFQFWIVLNSSSIETVEQQQVQEQIAHSISSFAAHNSSPILWFIVEFNQSTKHLQLMTWIDEGERKSNWKGEQAVNCRVWSLISSSNDQYQFFTVNHQNRGYYHVKNLPHQLKPSKFDSVLRLIVKSSEWMVRPYYH